MNCHQSLNQSFDDKLKDKKVQLQNKERLKLLMSKVLIIKKSIREYLALEKKCLSSNLNLIKTIENDESLSHEQVTHILRNYEKLKNKALFLNDKYTEKSKFGNLLHNSNELASEIQIDKIKSQISQMDVLINSANDEKLYLHNYMENVYQIKSDKIDDLKILLENDKSQKKKYLEKFKKYSDDEISKIFENENILISEVASHIIDNYLNFDKTITTVYHENIKMKKLINYYENIHDEVYKYNQELNQDITNNFKLKIKQTQQAKTFKTCHPNCNISINIPLATDLPI